MTRGEQKVQVFKSLEEFEDAFFPRAKHEREISKNRDPRVVGANMARDSIKNIRGRGKK